MKRAQLDGSNEPSFIKIDRKLTKISSFEKTIAIVFKTIPIVLKTMTIVFPPMVEVNMM